MKPNKFIKYFKDLNYSVSEEVKDYNNNKIILSLGITNNFKVVVPTNCVEKLILDAENPTFCELYDENHNKYVKFIGDIDYIDYSFTAYDENIDDKYINIINERIRPLFNKIYIAISHGKYYAPLSKMGKFTGSGDSTKIKTVSKLTNLYFDNYFNKIKQNDGDGIFVDLIDKYFEDVKKFDNKEFEQDKVIQNIINDRIKITDLWNEKHKPKYKKAYKYSYHIVGDMYFENMISMNAFVIKNNLDDILDTNIYTVLRKMRLPGCIKGFNPKNNFWDKRVMKIIEGEFNDFLLTKQKLDIKVIKSNLRSDIVTRIKFIDFLENENNFEKYKYYKQVKKINERFVEFIKNNKKKESTTNYNVLCVAFNIWLLDTKQNYTTFENYLAKHGLLINNENDRISIEIIN